jgi:hypothetical protein
MTPLEVPLTAESQTFVITLAGKTYTLALYWNWPSQCWVIDILTQDLVPLVLAVPLVTGEDLLAQYPHLVFGGSLVVQTDSDTDKIPGFGDLGTRGHLYFLTGTFPGAVSEKDTYRIPITGIGVDYAIGIHPLF